MGRTNPSGSPFRRAAIEKQHATVRIGTRASKLALTQAQWAADRLMAAHPGLACQLVHITTTGDRQRSQPLPQIGGKGLFTRELEDVLLRGDIQLAIHSLKDLPTQLPGGLVVAAVPERAPANDALISAECGVRSAECQGKRPRLFELPPGARIGTSSPRRAAQLRLARPDLCCEPIRGNLDTRLRKLAEGQFDAIVLAFAGLMRLGMADAATEVLPFDLMLPAPGQGALAIEAVAGSEAAALAAAIADPAATLATTAERALLDALGGGCSMPLGAYAELVEEQEEVRGRGTRRRTRTIGGEARMLRLRAILVAPDSLAAARAERTGPAGDPVGVAREVARVLHQKMATTSFCR